MWRTRKLTPLPLATLLGICCAAATLLLAGHAAAGKVPAAGQKTRVVVINEAHSPVLRALRRRLGNSLQIRKAASISRRAEQRQDLLIVDGDALSPRRMARAARLRRLVAAGKWVLALNLGRAHHRRAIARETGFQPGSGHPSAAFLFRRTTVGGEPRVEMVDVPTLRPHGASHQGKRRRKQARARLARRTARIVDQSIATGQLSAPGAPKPPAPGDSQVPPELQHVGWTYSVIGQATPKDGYWTAHKGDSGLIFYPQPGKQTVSWTMNHSFDVYLDNGEGHPQGNRQIVTYALDGQVSPKLPSENFFHMNDDFEVGTNKGYHLEKAWWTGGVASDVSPTPATDQRLTWQASEPQTPNADTQYTSGQAFEVGFSGSKEGAEVSGSYTVSNEKSYSVPDWGVQNNTTGNELNWIFTARNPCDPRQGHYDVDKCFKSQAFTDRTPEQPNELSLGQLQIHTNGRWVSKGLLEGGNSTLTFQVNTPIGLVDTYCDDFQFFACPPPHRLKQETVVGPKTQTYSFDADVVNPITIASLKLAPNPANGTDLEKVTGTVQLESKALMDTSVVIYSDSKNAVVGGPSGGGSQRTITIPQGQKSADFQIRTNDNNLSPGGHTTAAITAFYAEPTTEQLQIKAR